jgi:hypothetical protein
MPTPDPTSYANEWVRAWNAHDVEAVLDHFHDDVVFTNLSSAEAWPFTSARKSIPWVRPGIGSRLVGLVLLFDVLLDDGQWCAAAGGGDVGR